jgi:hypothetical protein
MGVMSAQPDIEAASKAFLLAAFRVLRLERVIPRPYFDPYVSVGYQYNGGSIMALPEYKTLEEHLQTAYSSRFPTSLTPPGYREHASLYVFAILDACVAHCARRDDFGLPNDIVDAVLGELFTMLGKTTYDVVCARHVHHLTTLDAREIQLGEIIIVPRTSHDDYTGLEDRIRREIAGAARAWNDRPPFDYNPPEALLVARRTTNGPNPYEDCDALSEAVSRFLFLARLLTSGTTYSAYEICGMPTHIAPMKPRMHTFDQSQLPHLVRRTVRLTGDEGPALNALGDLVDAAEVKRQGMAATSFDVALTKFNQSYVGGNLYEHLVDLATALEAVLIGSADENEGLSLRLRTRVAALLATENDSAVDLFKDVSTLYELRSRLVHGGQIKTKDLRKIITKVSTVTDNDVDDARFGIGVALAVDRMRDIVRRAILARLCLAEGPDPLWPLDVDPGVDAILADDNHRITWRAHWRQRLAALGVGQAADRAAEAVDFLTPEDA